MSELIKSTLAETLSALGEKLLFPSEELLQLIDRERQYNAWFTPENVLQAVKAIGKMLNTNDLEQWLPENANAVFTGKKVGLVLAGNIPLVGFHDVLCVLVSGHFAMIKASANDSGLISYILKQLILLEPGFASRYEFTERLANFDAVMATGSNNTSRYFEHYFGKVPNIIRKNRNSLAVLSGDETEADLQKAGHDIFDYFGLGCRSVSKILVPQGYNFGQFFRAIESFQPIINHHKYNNNYDYNKSIYLVNQDPHLDNGFLLLKQDEKIASPLAVVFYGFYADLDDVNFQLNQQQEAVQCVVSKMQLTANVKVVDFGESQQPKLWDYADGVNTMDFLKSI
ncbi:acyl-CoA reductase [Mucilaginibacter sp.]|uniref:acyl-CoA reductase n=1 Tax=Mucilaginibacter sp. TaxID=1882438 RepID=UPI003B00A9AA